MTEKVIAVIGLGYVGLPLAIEFGRRRQTIGFDINSQRIAELAGGFDRTLECSIDELSAARRLEFSASTEALVAAQIYIVTVPTPVDKAKRPDMTYLVRASETVGRALKRGDIVIYESTVYPGATEEICVPVLEKVSGLAANRDFFYGYSPERINPGDKRHRLPSIRKVTSGSTAETADEVDRLYREIIDAGTYKASSVKVAEAAKVIENIQRDVNIALMNELCLIFQRLGIDTAEVIEAAETKWNFLPFRPGLVGGHCIGVDPFYLTHKAQEVGYHPEIILAGRRINDSMAEHVANSTIKLMVSKGMQVLGSRALVLGLAFKENCPDVRNTKVIDIVNSLSAYGAEVDVHDPWVDPTEAKREYGLDMLTDAPAKGRYNAIVLAVGHAQFVEQGVEAIKALGTPDAVIFDVKSVLPAGSADGRL